MKCNRIDKCKQIYCAHFSEHDEKLNSEQESLCEQPDCYYVVGKVKCK